MWSFLYWVNAVLVILNVISWNVTGNEVHAYLAGLSFILVLIIVYAESKAI